MAASATTTVRLVALRRLAWFLPACIGGSGCDLQTKSWAEQTLTAIPTQSIMVFEPWLEWSLVYNRGTAFSVVAELGSSVRWALGALALVLVLAMVRLVLRSDVTRRQAVALGLIAGGAIGNGFDRLFRDAPGGGTGVVDFIKVNYPWGGSWPTFNVADVLLPLGVVLLIAGRVPGGWISASRSDATGG